MALRDLQELRVILNEHELYEVYYGGTSPPEYFSTQSQAVVLHSAHVLNPTPGTEVTYEPVPAIRDELENNDKLDGGELTVALPAGDVNMTDSLLDGGLSPVELRIIRGYGDPLTQAANFKRYWYIGHLSEIQAAGAVILATFRDKTFELDNISAPSVALQRLCNNDVYDDT